MSALREEGRNWRIPANAEDLEAMLGHWQRTGAELMLCWEKGWIISGETRGRIAGMVLYGFDQFLDPIPGDLTPLPSLALTEEEAKIVNREVLGQERTALEAATWYEDCEERLWVRWSSIEHLGFDADPTDKPACGPVRLVEHILKRWEPSRGFYHA